jgi:putative flavoprotein involved in K+ transport
MRRQPVTSEQFEVIIIGGSQAGLAMSYWLSQNQIDHIILEKGRLAERWRSERWDSFTIVTPNSSVKLPGLPYQGENPDGYMPRDEFVAFLENYAAQIQAPLRCGVHVRAIRQHDGNAGFWVETDSELLYSPNVVVATGILQLPRIPQPLSEKIPADILQLHSSQYQNSASLPEGAVLVVGSGQSGCQIAEDLQLSGRKVFLSVGKTGRIPRRYRSKDVYFWVGQAGLFTSNPDKFSNHAHVSGAKGGHDLNLYHFARAGIVLLGRIKDVAGNTLQIGPDLLENLAYADAFELDYLRQVDEYVESTGFEAPLQPGDRPRPIEQFEGELLTEINLAEANIRTIIWATGYRYDFSWIEIPVFDESGFPKQERGVTEIPGLYFLGMNWRTIPRSAFIGAVGGEAEVIANHLLTRKANQELEN